MTHSDASRFCLALMQEPAPAPRLADTADSLRRRALHALARAGIAAAQARRGLCGGCPGCTPVAPPEPTPPPRALAPRPAPIPLLPATARA